MKRAARASCGMVGLLVAAALSPAVAQDAPSKSRAEPLPVASSSAAWQKSQGFASWIPQGQRILFEAIGDLNKDGLDDAAILIGPMVPDEDGEPEPIKSNMAGAGPDYQYEPRRLIVLLSHPSGGLKKAFESSKVIPPARSREDNCLEDPAEEGVMKIDRGSLVITLSEWRSCGGWGSKSTTTRFRLEGDRLKLIGMDTSNMSRSTGLIYARSYNFITGKMVSTEREIQDDGPAKQVPGVVSLAKPRFLGDSNPECRVNRKGDSAVCQ